MEDTLVNISQRFILPPTENCLENMNASTYPQLNSHFGGIDHFKALGFWH